MSNPKKAVNFWTGTCFFLCLFNFSQIQTQKHLILLNLKKDWTSRILHFVCTPISHSWVEICVDQSFSHIFQYAIIAQIYENYDSTTFAIIKSPSVYISSKVPATSASHSSSMGGVWSLSGKYGESSFKLSSEICCTNDGKGGRISLIPEESLFLHDVFGTALDECSIALVSKIKNWCPGPRYQVVQKRLQFLTCATGDEILKYSSFNPLGSWMAESHRVRRK